MIDFKIKLVIPGTLRIKKNSRRIYGSGRNKKVLTSKAYEYWEDMARIKAAQYYMDMNDIINDLMYEKLHVKMLCFYKGQRPDLSGAMESVGDCFEKYLWDNDKQIESWDGSRLYHDSKNSRTEIYVRKYEED